MNTVSYTHLTIIENYMAEGNCLLRRLDRDRFLIVAEERQLRRMIERRFDILDQVRQVSLSDNVPSTLSIGIGPVSYTHLDVYKRQSQTMYARYERGGSELPIRHLITLCRYYQVSADFVLGLEAPHLSRERGKVPKKG